MIIAPEELVSVLWAVHLRYISEVQARCLAYLALGYTAEQSAESMAYSPASVRRHLSEIEEAVFVQAGLAASKGFLRTWV